MNPCVTCTLENIGCHNKRTEFADSICKPWQEWKKEIAQYMNEHRAENHCRHGLEDLLDAQEKAWEVWQKEKTKATMEAYKKACRVFQRELKG